MKKFLQLSCFTRLFKGLFWRIFAAVWLTNVVILFSVSYVLVSKMEAARHNERHQQQVARFSERLVDRYERRGVIELSRGDIRRLEQRPHGEDDETRRRDMANFALRINNMQQQTIFERGQWDPRPENLMAFSITSEKGTRYHIVCTPPSVPPFIRDILNRFMSLRLLLILIASTVASALLSWSIARPLRVLGQFNREFAEQGAAIDLPKNLLRRSDEIGDLTRDVQYMTQKIHHTLAGQQQLLHDVSHELRAPLARLQAAVALQEQRSVQHRYIEMIHRECDRINELIQRILDYARLNQLTEEPQTVNLTQLIKQCVSGAQLAEPDRSFMVTQPKEDITLQGYPALLVSAFENYLGNASKYSDPLDPVEIVLSTVQNNVCITVRDHGPGVSDEHLPRISEPFYRADHAHTADGFGLGLSIAQRAIEKHGGTVQFANHFETGLVVTIQLPR